MQITFPIYKYNSRITKTQKQNSQLTFTSKNSNGVINWIKEDTYTKGMQLKILALKEFSKLPDFAFDDAFIKKTSELLKAIEEKFKLYLNAISNDKSGILEEFTDAKWEALQKIASGENSPTYIRHYDSNNEAVKDILTDALGFIDNCLESSEIKDIYTYTYQKAVNRIRMLQIAVGASDDYHLMEYFEIPKGGGLNIIK